MQRVLKLSNNILQQSALYTAQLNAVRHSNYLSSPPVKPIEEYPEVEVMHNPPEWKYVERLLPPTKVPKPTIKADYPSGWRPQTIELTDSLSYFIPRTRNHMIPVYLKLSHRNMRRVTLIRRVQGDIWALEKELRQVVQQARNGKLCASRVNEMSQQIQFHGDYVDVLREYLKQKGF